MPSFTPLCSPRFTNDYYSFFFPDLSLSIALEVIRLLNKTFSDSSGFLMGDSLG